ncbi:MAG TPA: hypothetical protein VNL14_13885 [Candidatus Acidoferrales bacterium]|nr:hypothetical protein [Candidatus Acidoferrales bacterium]
MKRPQVYYLQNRAIHEARRQLEDKGILDPWAGLDQIRWMAADINLGVRSISRLSLEQRRVLIDRLIAMGAHVKNPFIYESDLRKEAGHVQQPRKVLVYRRVTEGQLRMLDRIASQIQWRERDGYLRFCYKIIKCPRPQNSRQVTILRAALESLLVQQATA